MLSRCSLLTASIWAKNQLLTLKIDKGMAFSVTPFVHGPLKPTKSRCFCEHSLAFHPTQCYFWILLVPPSHARFKLCMHDFPMPIWNFDTVPGVEGQRLLPLLAVQEKITLKLTPPRTRGDTPLWADMSSLDPFNLTHTFKSVPGCVLGYFSWLPKPLHNFFYKLQCFWTSNRAPRKLNFHLDVCSIDAAC